MARIKNINRLNDYAFKRIPGFYWFTEEERYHNTFYIREKERRMYELREKALREEISAIANQ